MQGRFGSWVSQMRNTLRPISPVETLGLYHYFLKMSMVPWEIPSRKNTIHQPHHCTERHVTSLPWTHAHSSSFWINHSYTVLQTSLQKCGDIFPEAAFPSSPVLSVSAVWSVVISVSVVFAIAEGGVRSLPRFCSCGLPVGFWAVSLLTALMVATWRLMPVWAAAVPAALILVWVVLQPFNV